MSLVPRKCNSCFVRCADCPGPAMTPPSSIPSDEELRKLAPTSYMARGCRCTECEALIGYLRAAYLAGQDAGLEAGAKRFDENGKTYACSTIAASLRALKGKPA